MVGHLDLRPDAEPMPGYRLRERIGFGGFAEVWEVDAGTGVPLALKFMRCKDSRAAAEEIRALQALKQLRHPHLIPIHQVWLLPGYVVISMDRADGSMLDLLEAYLEEFGSALGPEQVCVYLRQAAAGLDYLNSKQHPRDGRRVAYQHCDVKPNNLLLFGDLVQVADYGLATMMITGVSAFRPAGTVAYAPPEVFNSRISDRSDQYSLAVTYTYLRCGRLPWDDSPSRFDPKYVRPDPDLDGLEAPEREVVRRALNPSPIRRWPSCVALMDELGRLFDVKPPADESYNGSYRH